ncbi:hypothetical protein SAMN05421803_14514 [Nocardiopsis flavescens]|uniref:Uncharacterized protein n=1 Tax=Nocardiopsis flavescens TaxID=758803 RepID=A0A1M6WK18_9ACTN|nr:hypothetical protein SAMN05421803_14514 [Nocardiopsis flavescens]
MDLAPAQSAGGRPLGRCVGRASIVVGVCSGAGSSEAIPAQPPGAGGMPPAKGGGRDKRPVRRTHPCPPNAIGGETCTVSGSEAQPVSVDPHPDSRGSTRAYSAPRTHGGEGRAHLPAAPLGVVHPPGALDPDRRASRRPRPQGRSPRAPAGRAPGGCPPARSPRPRPEGVAPTRAAGVKPARTLPASPPRAVHPQPHTLNRTTSASTPPHALTPAPTSPPPLSPQAGTTAAPLRRGRGVPRGARAGVRGPPPTGAHPTSPATGRGRRGPAPRAGWACRGRGG